MTCRIVRKLPNSSATSRCACDIRKPASRTRHTCVLYQLTHCDSFDEVSSLRMFRRTFDRSTTRQRTANDHANVTTASHRNEQPPMTTMTIDSEKPVWILQGDFGRATVNLISRPLVAHAHAQYQFLFKLGGADCGFRIGAQDCMLTNERAICLNPWIEHAKSGNDDMPSLILSLVVETSWLRARLQLAESGPAGIFP